jgi:hypothetical protein
MIFCNLAVIKKLSYGQASEGIQISNLRKAWTLAGIVTRHPNIDKQTQTLQRDKIKINRNQTDKVRHFLIKHTFTGQRQTSKKK